MESPPKRKNNNFSGPKVGVMAIKISKHCKFYSIHIPSRCTKENGVRVAKAGGKGQNQNLHWTTNSISAESRSTIRRKKLLKSIQSFSKKAWHRDCMHAAPRQKECNNTAAHKRKTSKTHQTMHTTTHQVLARIAKIFQRRENVSQWKLS